MEYVFSCQTRFKLGAPKGHGKSINLPLVEGLGEYFEKRIFFILLERAYQNLP